MFFKTKHKIFNEPYECWKYHEEKPNNKDNSNEDQCKTSSHPTNALSNQEKD